MPSSILLPADMRNMASCILLQARAFGILAILSNHRRCLPDVQRNQVRLAIEWLARAEVCSCRRIRIASFHIWPCLPLTATLNCSKATFGGPLWRRAAGVVVVWLWLWLWLFLFFPTAHFQWRMECCSMLPGYLVDSVIISKLLGRYNSPTRQASDECKSYLSVLCGYTYLYRTQSASHFKL